MSLPRRIIAGSSYLLTRRVAQRQFLLRPSEATNQIVSYALAYAALVTGVVVHAFVAMSNHIHVVVTDPYGRVSDFLHRLDRHIACCMNASMGKTENVWGSAPPSVVELETDEDVLEKIAYVIANPTAAGLVSSPEEWPGVLLAPNFTTEQTARRPSVFYRRDGKMPVAIDISVTTPALQSFRDENAVLARLSELVDEKLREARAELAENGERFLGRQRVLATRTTQTARTPETARTLRPRFAAKRGDARRRALEQLRAFHHHYARSLQAWKSGDRDVVFPAGTYLMRIRHGVFVDPAH